MPRQDKQDPGFVTLLDRAEQLFLSVNRA